MSNNKFRKVLCSGVIMKKIMLSLASLLVLGSGITLQAENGRGADFSVKDIDKAIQESKPEKLRELAQHITLTKADKESYLEKARKISKSRREKLKKGRGGKDKIHIAKGVSYGILGIPNVLFAIECALLVSEETNKRRPNNKEIAKYLGLGSVGIITTGALLALAISEIRKGWTKFDGNSELNQALAVEAVLNTIATK
jgi:hypothetical protein